MAGHFVALDDAFACARSHSSIRAYAPTSAPSRAPIRDDGYNRRRRARVDGSLLEP